MAAKRTRTRQKGGAVMKIKAKPLARRAAASKNPAKVAIDDWLKIRGTQTGPLFIFVEQRYEFLSMINDGKLDEFPDAHRQGVANH